MKYNKRSFKQRVLVCQMAASGVSRAQISKLTGIGCALLEEWYLRYRLHGSAGLKRLPYKLRSIEEKRSLILAFQKKNVSLPRFCAEHRVSMPQFQRWMADPQINDPLVLTQRKNAECNTDMGRHKKQAPQTEIEKLQAELAYLRAENALLKKSKGFDGRKRSPSTRDWAKAIRSLKPEHSLDLLLSIKGMARSTYFYNLKEQQDKYAEIRQKILSVFHQNKGRYGYRRVYMELRAQEINVNHKTVARLMQDMGLRAVRRTRHYRSYKGEVCRVAPNVIQRDFSTSGPN